MATVTIDEIVIADDPASWSLLGFELVGDRAQLGDVWLRFVGTRATGGILGWSLRGLVNDQLDGLPTCSSAAAPPNCRVAHPNGVIALDHIVVISPAVERSVEALTMAGLDLRRIGEEPTPAGAPRQAFFRLGQEILEVVQEPDDVVVRAGGSDGPLRFWGLALRVHDLKETVERISPHTSEIRSAVQPGRTIATVRRSAALTIPVALIS